LNSSRQLSKYNWINFSSKQRSLYFTKSSRGQDPTSQRAGFGPRAVCLTHLTYMLVKNICEIRLEGCAFVKLKLCNFLRNTSLQEDQGESYVPVTVNIWERRIFNIFICGSW